MTFTAPGSGASATPSTGTAAIGADGTASITATANATAGTYSVTASASGVATPASFALTNQYQPVFSGLTDQTITYGTGSVVFSGSLSDGSQVPAGDDVTVTLDGVDQLAVIGDDGSFSTTFTTATLGVAGSPYTLSYDFQAQGSFLGADGTSQLTVNQAATTTSLVSSANPSVFGQDVTFTAFVTATAPGTGTPDGQAQLSVDGSAVGQPFTLTGGQGSITVAHFNNLIGDHTVQVNYLGSANYKGSDSVVDVQTVNPVATTTTLSSALNPSKYGQSAMLTATVQATGGTIQPTSGTVQFWDGTALLGSASLANSNQASFSISALAAGSHSLTAVLLASANFQTSTSGSITQQVVKNQTVVQLGCAMADPTATPAIDPAAITAAARIHRQVVFTILVHPAGVPAYLATEGKVTIYQSNNRFVATLPVKNGQATLNRYLCQVFQKSYYAVYNGTRNLGRARSNMVRVTMSPVIAGAQSAPPVIVPKVTPHAPKATHALALHANRAAVLRKG